MLNEYPTPITLCDLAIIGKKIEELGRWYIGIYHSKGFSSTEDSLIVDPYLIILETENMDYVLSVFKEDTGYHLIVFYSIEKAEEYLNKLRELCLVDNKIVRNNY